MVQVLRFCLLAALLVADAPIAAAAVNLSGQWEVQSMGADRQLSLQQKGNKIIAHRVMWPEFEGEKYKLEHLYRGRVQGSKIRGQLLVREEEIPDFEVLREFVGSIDSDSKITLDGLPMKKVGKGGDGLDKLKGPKGRGSDIPSFGSISTEPARPGFPTAPSLPARESPSPRRALLDRDALGEIARLLGVGAT